VLNDVTYKTAAHVACALPNPQYALRAKISNYSPRDSGLRIKVVKVKRAIRSSTTYCSLPLKPPSLYLYP